MDRLLEILGETSERRYAFKVHRRKQGAIFTRGGMQAAAAVIPAGRIRVVYEAALHEPVEEICTTPEQAAAMIEAIMARKHLGRVPRPEA